MVKEDYVMRLIHEMVKTVLKLLFGVDERKDDDIEFEDMELEKAYRRMLALADEGKLEEAEDSLSDYIDGVEPEGFKMAMLFYDHINRFDEERLEASGFSREEITDGILAAAKRYGHDGMISALLEKE